MLWRKFKVVKGAEGSKESVIAGRMPRMPDISLRLIGHGILFKGF
jgi:hypothetical protein